MKRATDTDGHTCCRDDSEAWAPCCSMAFCRTASGKGVCLREERGEGRGGEEGEGEGERERGREREKEGGVCVRVCLCAYLSLSLSLPLPLPPSPSLSLSLSLSSGEVHHLGRCIGYLSGLV